MKKRLMALSLAAVLATATLVGCGGTGTSSSVAESTAPQASQSVAASTADPASTGETPTTTVGSALNISIVTSPSGVDDGSFNQNNYDGINDFILNYPDSTVTAVRETDIANSIPAVESIVADYDVVVTPGFQFAEISKIAVDNPDKKFILVDSFPTEVDGQTEFENVYAMTFSEQESGFFAGIAAALETKTNKVAVVNGIAYPSNVSYQKGFESGVNYANAHYGTTVELVSLPTYSATDASGNNIGGNYVGTFDDEATGKVVGTALLDAGVDIIFVAAGGSGNGVFTAVKERGNAMVIGCDVDQYDDGANGATNIVLTSALKVMDLNVDRALTAIADGTFVGANVVLGADTDSTGMVVEAGRQQLTPETIAIYNEVFTLVKGGEIVPAADPSVNSYTPEDFPGLAA